MNRRQFMLGVAALGTGPAGALAASPTAADVLDQWFQFTLKLVRHTPIYSPPVASRSFAYLGIIAFEAVASGNGRMQSLAGQLNGLAILPGRKAHQRYNESVVLNAALATAVQRLFAKTGPTGQRAFDATASTLQRRVSMGVKQNTLMRSKRFGEALAKHVLEWADSDGGAVITNLGFPETYQLKAGPGHWVPTNTIGLQQAPLLPDWGNNRSLAMPASDSCRLPPHPAYDEDRNSAFFKEALEVYETSKTLTQEQKNIARFWSDDPMLSSTPPGHWIAISLAVFAQDKTPLERRVDVLARLGIAMADAFIGCWSSKYDYDLLRPITFIRKHIDPNWETLLITPPFPEYPSGHSVQSGAAATVLTAAFGNDFAFDDASHVEDGLATRHYPSFFAAAQEAAVSRLYGGIHFRSAIARGLDQGKCIGAYAVALKTMRTP